MITRNNIGLRAVEKKDLEILKDWRNIPSFRKNFREVRELNNDNQEKWFDIINNSPNEYMFVFEDIENKIPVGAGGLLYINWIIRSADFSFYIGHDHGYVDEKYAVDAASLLIEYGFNNLNLNKIWMELYEFDLKKINFFKNKFNFKIDGRLRDNCFEDGRYWDSLLISLTLKDYRNESK
jgi:RimJ/RimL family protein N-acetyltransferase